MTELATQEVARARAAQIRAGIQNYLHTLANIAAAYAQRDWKVLGYGSWEAYVDGEYGADRLRLSPEHRQKAVQELRLGGMSTRAIGAAVGASEATVRRDIAGASDDAPAEIQGADGKTYAATRPTPDSSQADARPDAPAAGESAAREAETAVVAPVDAGAPVVADWDTVTTGQTAAEELTSPSADADGEVAHSIATDRADAAPEVPAEGAGTSGVTPWSQRLQERVADVHDFITDFPARAFIDATPTDFAEVLDLLERIEDYGREIRAAYAAATAGREELR